MEGQVSKVHQIVWAVTALAAFAFSLSSFAMAWVALEAAL
jgi:hypothetical protein